MKRLSFLAILCLSSMLISLVAIAGPSPSAANDNRPAQTILWTQRRGLVDEIQDIFRSSVESGDELGQQRRRKKLDELRAELAEFDENHGLTQDLERASFGALDVKPITDESNVSRAERARRLLNTHGERAMDGPEAQKARDSFREAVERNIDQSRESGNPDITQIQTLWEKKTDGWVEPEYQGIHTLQLNDLHTLLHLAQYGSVNPQLNSFPATEIIWRLSYLTYNGSADYTATEKRLISRIIASIAQRGVASPSNIHLEKYSSADRQMVLSMYNDGALGILHKLARPNKAVGPADRLLFLSEFLTNLPSKDLNEHFWMFAPSISAVLNELYSKVGGSKPEMRMLLTYLDQTLAPSNKEPRIAETRLRLADRIRKSQRWNFINSLMTCLVSRFSYPKNR